MEVLIKAISATYFVGSETLRISHNAEVIFKHCIENCEGLDYWHSLTINDEQYDINLHRHDDFLSLQIYPVVDGVVNGGVWQDIPLAVFDI